MNEASPSKGGHGGAGKRERVRKKTYSKEVIETQQSGMSDLPVELIAMIMKYLPSSDLINCRSQSRMWEEEATKIILSRNTVRLDGFNFYQYMDVMGTRNNCHKKIYLKFMRYVDRRRSGTGAAALRYAFGRFYGNFMGTVRHISVDWLLTPRSWYYLELLSGLPKLTSLELRAIRSATDLEKEPIENISDLIPIGSQFRFVNTLSIKVKICDAESRSILKSENLALELLRMFPKLSSLKIWNTWSPFIGALKSKLPNMENEFDNITSLSFFTQNNYLDAEHKLNLILQVPLTNVRELEFNIKVHLNPDDFTNEADRLNLNECQEWEEILEKFAPSLEKVNIRHVRNTFRDNGVVGPCDPLIVKFPVMPNLQSLKISRSPHDAEWSHQYNEVTIEEGFPESCYPCVQLGLMEYDAQDPRNGRVDYPKLFPKLEILSVLPERNRRFLKDVKGLHQQPLTNNQFFETMLPMLYSSFLPAHNPTPSESLKSFETVWPDSKNLHQLIKILSGQSCRCLLRFPQEKCECWGREKLHKIYKRLVNNFPKVTLMESGERFGQYNKFRKELLNKRMLKYAKELGILKPEGWVIDKLPIPDNNFAEN